jgi:inosine-uridine nucleoside N-ribohydrolase
VIAIGPLPNLAAAIEREPRIVKKSQIIGMHGSIRRGYNGLSKVDAEWNVRTYVQEAQIVFNSPWQMTITPLDTCGMVRLGGEGYKRILDRRSPLTEALIDSYRAWLERPGSTRETRWDADYGSSVLFDTVAIYLAMSTDWLAMEQLGLSVTDNGYTVIDSGAKQVDCAMEWLDMRAYDQILVERLTK